MTLYHLTPERPRVVPSYHLESKEKTNDEESGKRRRMVCGKREGTWKFSLEKGRER